MPPPINDVGSGRIFYAFGIGGHGIARGVAPLAGQGVRRTRIDVRKGQLRQHVARTALTAVHMMLGVQV